MDFEEQLGNGIFCHVNLPAMCIFCTYDTFIADDLTIDMISCQEQLSSSDGTSDWYINIRFENVELCWGCVYFGSQSCFGIWDTFVHLSLLCTTLNSQVRNVGYDLIILLITFIIQQ